MNAPAPAAAHVVLSPISPSRRTACHACASTENSGVLVIFQGPRGIDSDEIGSLREDQGRRFGGVRGPARPPGTGVGGAEERRGAGQAGRLRGLPHRSVHGLGGRPLRLRADCARPRGRRRRGGRRRGRHLALAGRPRRDPLLPAMPRVHPLPERPDQSLPRDPGHARAGVSSGRNDPTFPRRRASPAFHGHLDVRGVHGHARDRTRESLTRGTSRRRMPVRMWALDGPRRRDEYGQGLGWIDLRGLRGGDGRTGSGRRLPSPGCRADHLRRPLAGAARAGTGPGSNGPSRGRARRWSSRSSS